MDFEKRSSGVLLHVTSLPGRHGSGDLGRGAYDFVAFCGQASLTWWQMLPVGPIGPAPGFSPYSSSSTRAGEPMLIDLESLRELDLLTHDELAPPSSFRDDRVLYPLVQPWRATLLRRAFERLPQSSSKLRRDLQDFSQKQASWLDDFALFAAMKRRQRNRPWWKWDRTIARRDQAALRDAAAALRDEADFHRFCQFLFFRQWKELRAAARARGVGLIGDLPIFVAHDSVEVWTSPQLFQLDKNGMPRQLSGYPPDVFSPRGQMWGHPQYDWQAHEREGFAWWIERFAALFGLFDAIRIDHFLGFDRVWSIPARKADPRRGRWVDTPGLALFTAVRKKLGTLPIIAEDLGRLTDRAAALRDRLGLPGMRVMMFGVGVGGGSEYHRPHDWPARSVAYTGTHDNDTVVGYYRSLDAASRRRMLEFYNAPTDRELPDAMLRALYASPARTVITPLQDMLGLDGSARMNVPSTTRGNWAWRVGEHRPTTALARRLARLADLYDRKPKR
jgi:4-alpha-glucanotransferase